jgi:hypothetical protein|tara:strand:- start:494 stop:916 length:423 start_codon:yes stop_codon:yes gene_type:complete
MDKSIAIFAASVLGLSVGAGTMLYVNNAQVDTKLQEIVEVVETDPADDVVNITTTEGKTFTVMRKNVKCETNTLRNFKGIDVQYRNCQAHGVMSDLAGNKTHYSERGMTCFTKDGEFANWTNAYEIQSMACSAAIEFGAS